jgi:nucleotide-binding universal stress UspA family protein
MSKPLGRVLAATDLSAPSLHAVDRAFLVASQAGAACSIANALGLGALTALREALGQQYGAVSRKIAERQRESLEAVASDPSRNRGVSASVDLLEGTATAAIPLHAEAIGADLVVVGARGQGFLERFVLGSTASRLLRTSGRPVLIVKEPCHGPYRRALVAVDFSSGSKEAVEFATRVAPGAVLVLTHAFDVPFEGMMRYAGVADDVVQRYRIQVRHRAQMQLNDLAAGAGLGEAEYVPVVVHGDAARQILVQAEQRDCDLIVVRKHASAMEQLLLGSVAKRVLDESRADVLVIVDEQATPRPAAAKTA